MQLLKQIELIFTHFLGPILAGLGRDIFGKTSFYDHLTYCHFYAISS